MTSMSCDISYADHLSFNRDARQSRANKEWHNLDEILQSGDFSSPPLIWSNSYFLSYKEWHKLDEIVSTSSVLSYDQFLLFNKEWLNLVMIVSTFESHAPLTLL